MMNEQIRGWLEAVDNQLERADNGKESIGSLIIAVATLKEVLAAQEGRIAALEAADQNKQSIPGYYD